MMRSVTGLLGLVATALLGLGCSGFERQWQAAAATPPPADDITGRWVGTWQSDYNDHTGGLRAIVTQNADGSYLVQYHATYGTVLTFTYTYDLEDMEAEVRDGVYHFAGESDLGFFGTYSHEGRATPYEFVANYEASAGDFGTYRMQRPKEEE